MKYLSDNIKVKLKKKKKILMKVLQDKLLKMI